MNPPLHFKYGELALRSPKHVFLFLPGLKFTKHTNIGIPLK